MHFRIISLYILIVVVLTAGCSDSNKQVLEEVKALRKEVSQLREAVSEVHRVAIDSRKTNANRRVAKANISLDIEGSHSFGSDSAEVAIVEFSDYQCPFCTRFHKQTFPSLKNDYIDSGKIRYIMKDYPLGFHSNAKAAAIAANCAAEQNALMAMKDSLFENQRQLGPELYKELAQKHKLDVEKFEVCLKNPQQTQKVERDIGLGGSLAVNGTPHFFVGRIKDGRLVDARRIAGAQPYSVFAQALDNKLN